MRGPHPAADSGLKLIGCAVVVAVAAALLVTAAVVAVLSLRDADRADRDPALRAERARELTGGSLPAGFHPAGVFSLRGAIEIVVLSAADRREAGLDPDADPRIVLLTLRRPSREWRPFLETGKQPRETLARDGIDVRGRIEGSGAADWDGVPVRWIAVDGPVGLPGGRDLIGRSVLVAPACPGRPARLAAWQPASYPAVSTEERRAAVFEVLRPLEPCW